MACLGNSEKFVVVRVQNTGGMKVRAGCVSIDAGMRMSLGCIHLAVERLDTVLDWKTEQVNDPSYILRR